MNGASPGCISSTKWAGVVAHTTILALGGKGGRTVSSGSSLATQAVPDQAARRENLLNECQQASRILRNQSVLILLTNPQALTSSQTSTSLEKWPVQLSQAALC